RSRRRPHSGAAENRRQEYHGSPAAYSRCGGRHGAWRRAAGFDSGSLFAAVEKPQSKQRGKAVMNQQNANAETYILFEIAGTTYGVSSRSVQQMEMVEHITPLPNAPAFIEGVVFTRGQVIPAVNLRTRFGFEKAPHTTRTRLIVTNHNGRGVGLVV